MTFSDVLTVLGAGVGLLVLLAMAVTPLLADLDPSPARRARRRAARTPAAPRPLTIPVPRKPSDVSRPRPVPSVPQP